MAGGWTTTALVAAVSEAGGLGSLAGAMLAPDALREQIRAVRSLTAKPFAVNLFAPLAGTVRGRAGRLGGAAAACRSRRPRRSHRGFADQLSVVIDERVPVLSFTFGAPDRPAIRLASPSAPRPPSAEAVALAAAGVDAVVAQGYEAGGHRGTFLAPGREQSLIGTMALVPQIVDAVPVPVIASGGIMDGRGHRRGAERWARRASSSARPSWPPTRPASAPAYRQALGQPTTVTDVLTGRHARAVRTAAGRHGWRRPESPPPDYPLPRLFLTEPPFLAGQGAPMARAMPAARIGRAAGARDDDSVRQVIGLTDPPGLPARLRPRSPAGGRTGPSAGWSAAGGAGGPAAGPRRVRPGCRSPR